MKILLNGEARDIGDDTRLSQLIEQLDLTGKRLAVEVNREIVPRSQHNDYVIRQGDNIEIVHAIGGG
jgi:sulfur carrier protein